MSNFDVMEMSVNDIITGKVNNIDKLDVTNNGTRNLKVGLLCVEMMVKDNGISFVLRSWKYL